MKDHELKTPSIWRELFELLGKMVLMVIGLLILGAVFGALQLWVYMETGISMISAQ